MLEELKQLAELLKQDGYDTAILAAIAEIERLRATNHDYQRGLEITAQILTTLGRDPLPTLAGRLNQIVVLAEFRKTDPT